MMHFNTVNNLANMHVHPLIFSCRFPFHITKLTTIHCSDYVISYSIRIQTHPIKQSVFTNLTSIWNNLFLKKLMMQAMYLPLYRSIMHKD